MPNRVVGSPVLLGDRIASGCGDNGFGLRLVVVRPPDADGSQAQILITNEEEYVPYVPTPLAVNNRLFLFHDQGIVTCYDTETNAVIWSEKPGGKFFGSPVLVGDRIYIVNFRGEVTVFGAGDEYERLAVNDLGEESSATPAVADGRMIIRTRSHVYCVGSR